LTDIRLAGSAVPFLLITAFGGDDVREAAGKLGAEVLDKPFAATELVRRVRRMCGLPD
jgi:DNA-binding response OmpR family regulator